MRDSVNSLQHAHACSKTTTSKIKAGCASQLGVYTSLSLTNRAMGSNTSGQYQLSVEAELL